MPRNMKNLKYILLFERNENWLAIGPKRTKDNLGSGPPYIWVAQTNFGPALALYHFK